MGVFRIYTITFLLSLACLVVSGQVVKNLDSNVIKHEFAFWNDSTGNAGTKTLLNATFWRPLNTTDSLKSNKDRDHLLWILGQQEQPIRWVRTIIINITPEFQRLTIHTGNIEFAKYFLASESKHFKNAGLFRNPMQAPEFQIDLGPMESDTLYISIENYVVEPKYVHVHIGLENTIRQEKNNFKKQYEGWHYFQNGFIFLFLFISVTIFFTWLFQRDRIEFLYYSFCLALFSIFFGALFWEVQALSFTFRLVPGAPPFSVYYLKGLFIVYSWAYFHYFNQYLGFNKEDSELSAFNRFIEIIQSIVIIMEICLLFAHIPTLIKFYAFIIGGALLNLVAIGYNAAIKTRREVQFALIEVQIMNAVAFMMNVVMVPFTIFEMIIGWGWLSPSGFMGMQISMLTEAAFFHFTSNQKTKRLQKEYNEELAKRLEAEKQRKEIGRDFHDLIGGYLASMGYKIHNIIGLLPPSIDQNIIINLKEINDIAKKVDKDFRWLIWQTDHENCSLQALLEKINKEMHALFDDTDTECTMTIPKQLISIGITPLQQKNIYLFAKEALTNALKHAEAKRINVNFQWETDALFQFEIKDDGRGFCLDNKRLDGFGLDSLKCRAAEIESEFSVSSSVGKGTTLLLKGRLWESPNGTIKPPQINTKIATLTYKFTQKILKLAHINFKNHHFM